MLLLVYFRICINELFYAEEFLGGLGMGDGALGPIPNPHPQSPIPII